MNVDIPDDEAYYHDGDDDGGGGRHIEYRTAVDDQRSTIDIARYVKYMLAVIVLGYLIVRAHNAFVSPLFDALKEQRKIINDHTINYNNKCLDPRVKASYQGFDKCLEHADVIESGLYYPAFKSYMRKMDPCSEKGCLTIEMNAVSWLTLLLPLGFGIGALLTIVMLVLIVIGVHRMLSARYEFPDRMPAYSKARWTPSGGRPSPARRRPTLEGSHECAR